MAVMHSRLQINGTQSFCWKDNLFMVLGLRIVLWKPEYPNCLGPMSLIDKYCIEKRQRAPRSASWRPLGKHAPIYWALRSLTVLAASCASTRAVLPRGAT